MDTAELIVALGGTLRVARLCGVRATAVSNWKKNGRVPPVHHVRLWRETRARGLDWSPPDAADAELVIPATSRAE